MTMENQDLPDKPNAQTGFAPSPGSRSCPVPGYDIAMGDTVWWKARDGWGAWVVNSMHYVLNDGRPAASVIPVSEFDITGGERLTEIAPLDELRCIRDAVMRYSENVDYGEQNSAITK